MTHPQLDPGFHPITSITFRNIGYGYRTASYVEDLSALLKHWNIKHDVVALYSEHGHTSPELVIHTHGDMELVKLRLEKRLIKVDVWRSKEVRDLWEAEMKAVNASNDWGKELTMLIGHDPHLLFREIDWLACKAMIFDAYEYIGDIGYFPLDDCHYFRLPGQEVTKVSTMQLALDNLRTRTC